jgi:hypothetical protein
MEEMAAGRERRGDRPIGHAEVLRVSWGLASSHTPLSLAGRSVGILGAIGEMAVRPMLDTGQHPPLGRTIAHQLIGADDPRYGHQPLEEWTKELPRGGPITLASDQELRM